jgi:hypothetical protein
MESDLANIGQEFRPLRLVWGALQGAQLWKGKRKRSHFFNWPYPMSPRSLELRGNFQTADDHIFEKTLKIELSPIPQAYPLNTDLFMNLTL